MTGMDDLRLVACPWCHAQLTCNCDNLTCSSGSEGFAKFGGKRALIGSERNLVDQRSFLANNPGNAIERDAVSRLRACRLMKHLAGSKRVRRGTPSCYWRC
jgi:hypothetical protein